MLSTLWPVREQFWFNKPKWTIWEFGFLYHGFQPTESIHIQTEDDYEIRRAVWDWVAWAPGCPEVDPNEAEPCEVPIPREKLVRWASTLSGVQLPEWMLPLLDDSQSDAQSEPHVQQAKEIGEVERQTLLRIIGGLASALVEAKDKSEHGLKSDTGTSVEPNISGLTRLCQKHTGTKKKGMSKSRMDSLISEGLQTLKK